MSVTYTRREDMPERYLQTLEQMMKSQAYRELAAARLFGHGLQFVDEARWLKFMVWHIREETEHYFAVAEMYERFTGESVEPWVRDIRRPRRADGITRLRRIRSANVPVFAERAPARAAPCAGPG